MRSAYSVLRVGRDTPRLARFLLVTVLVGILLVGSASSAVAHVLLDRATPNDDGTTTLAFSFDHGCDGQPTDQLNFIVPPGIEVLDTQQPAGWAAQIEGSQVNWTGDPLPDGEANEFELITSITGVPGQEFVFPVVQSCVGGGQYSWTDTDSGSTSPAPSFIATTATLSGGDEDDQPSGASTKQALIAIAVAAVVMGGGGAALASRRRRSN